MIRRRFAIVPRLAGRVAALALACAAATGVARAQTGPPPGGSQLPPQVRPSIMVLRGDALRAQAERPMPPMTGAQLGKLREAQTLHQNGMFDRARDQLLALSAELPHHPIVLGELAQVYLDMKNFTAAEQLAKAERKAAGDSLVLGVVLELAQERLGHTRDAVATALEVWVSTPDQAEWAASALLRLTAADTKGVLETVRRAAANSGGRADLERGLAIIEWRTGDVPAALQALAIADRSGRQPSWRWMFADELLSTGNGRDSSAAVQALVALAGDPSRVPPERTQAARRAWNLAELRNDRAAVAPLMQKALSDQPPGQWDSHVLLGVARGLREAGRTNDSRALLAVHGDDPSVVPGANLERALADLRDGPPAKALPALAAASQVSTEALFRYAEALFYAGMADSALTQYQLVVKQTQSPFTGAAFERLYLIEDADPKDALPAFGRLAYETWRGNRAAGATAESLYRDLPRGPLWAQAALLLSARREQAGDAKGALGAALAVADSLPDDRLASAARQRAGDLYRVQFKDDAKALAQYEECLARYPRAWNSAEVRRRVELMRRDKRF